MTAVATRRTRPVGIAAALVAFLLATAALWLGGASSAWAATDDTYDRFDIEYTVGTDGVTHVKETITSVRPEFGPARTRPRAGDP